MNRVKPIGKKLWLEGETRAGLEKLMVQVSASMQRQVKQKVEIWAQCGRWSTTGQADVGRMQGEEERNSWEEESFRGSWKSP